MCSTMSSHFLILNTPLPADLDAVQSAIPKLVEMAMKDEDSSVRMAGMRAMVSLARDGMLSS